jgi:LmbE family N-acetylglucosaminyl deacetylase
LRSQPEIGVRLKPDPSRAKRIVVVSPHLDDGVLSLGAAIAAWGRAGARVELLTVLACDPDSSAPTGGWDARAGHATEGASARARREEDSRACAILGATPVWLPFGSVDYDRHGSDDEVLAAVASSVDGADEALLPGFPLSHPDHAWLASLLAGRLGVARLGEFAEPLYVRRSGERLPSDYEPIEVSARDRLAKWRAIRGYRSQLPLLALSGVRRGPHTLLGPELVAWAGSDSSPAAEPGSG